ncbi:hypothetical protein Q6346_04870 [Isoptericola sp. b490]|uniref:hypothetical protein n=1 Tax=Actinotalea lenta TaxID=3064654 RepID=UPI002712515D|nr:hypothetical protein [Isoptericola sp. b490]MDO8120645.1 hypothetical protein [Isoptericola sp. b490]
MDRVRIEAGDLDHAIAELAGAEDADMRRRALAAALGSLTSIRNVLVQRDGPHYFMAAAADRPRGAGAFEGLVFIGNAYRHDIARVVPLEPTMEGTFGSGPFGAGPFGVAWFAWRTLDESDFLHVPRDHRRSLPAYRDHVSGRPVGETLRECRAFIAAAFGF